MELLSIVLLCVFIPVTVLLLLCLVCVSLYWEKKWKSRNKSDDIEATGNRGRWKSSRENVTATFRFQDEIRRTDTHEEAHIPLMVLGKSGRTELNTDQQYIVDQTAADKRQKPSTIDSICTKERSSQTTCLETKDAHIQIIYAVKNAATQTDEISSQTTCIDTIDKHIQTIYAVKNEGTQTDEAVINCEPLPQDAGIETFNRSGRRKKQKKNSKAKRKHVEGTQDGAKHSRVDTFNVLQFDYPKGNSNLGNTCFFNSTLQALYFTKSFEDSLSCLKKSTSNFDSLKLTKSVLDLLEKKNVNHTQELRGVLNAVRSINDQFGHGTQEDSYELLNTLLGGIFDELQTASENGTFQSTDVDSDKNGISVKSLFTGLFITIYVYDSCNDVEVDFEEFTTLSIPIVEEQEKDFDKLPHTGLQTISSEEPSFDIEKGLAVLTQIEDYEESDLSCRICNTEGFGKAYRRMLVFQPPPVLVIHIDRFKMNEFNRLTKNPTCVQYPRRFNMARFCSVANTELSTDSLIYELYAVVVHSGALGGGHYYAYVNTTRRHDVDKWQEHLNRSNGDLEELKIRVEKFLREKHDFHDVSRYTDLCEVKDNWFCVSDNNVCSANVGQAMCHKDAYILFYEVQ